MLTDPRPTARAAAYALAAGLTLTTLAALVGWLTYRRLR